MSCTVFENNNKRDIALEKAKRILSKYDYLVPGS
jgi:hypothetical protein